MLKAVNAARQYTHCEQASQEKFAEVYTLLSIAIDELRMVYKNIGERITGSRKEGGLYPFEPLKGIREEINKLGFDTSFAQHTAEDRKQARDRIERHWHSLVAGFLPEFDRPVPTKPVSHYLPKKKALWRSLIEMTREADMSDGPSSVDLKQYDIYVDLFKFYVDTAFKAVTWFYGITGAILTYYFAHAAQQKDGLNPKPGAWSLAFVGVFSLLFSLIYLGGYRQALKMQVEFVEIEKILA
jgi:hypothetical protein